jgi:outer membrane protein
MRKFLIVAIALCFMASSAAYAADTTIGIVDMQALVTQSVPAKETKSRMESKYGAEKAQLEKQSKELQALAESMKKSSVTEAKKDEFIRKKRDLDEKVRSLTRKIDQDSNEVLDIIFYSTAQVAKSKNIDMVVEVRNGGIMYAQPAMDITKDVLNEVNKQYKSGEWKKAKK